ncbi:MAG: MFS transporter [Clostridia bacterium]|nr:MFS transporter [Clostridia bacterium]
MELGAKAITRERLWSRDFVTITLITLCTFLGFQMLLPTLPIYVKNLGGGDTSAGLVVGLFTFSAVLVRPFTGYALDVYGRKGLFLTGLMIFALCVLAYTWAPSLFILLVLRFIHGFGWGLSSTASSTVVADIIPKSRIGEGMGYYGLAGTLSMALAPALGLYIINEYSFNTLFLLAAFMVTISIVLAFNLNYKEVNPVRPGFTLVEKASLRPTLVIFLITMTYGSIVSFLALYAVQQGIENIGPFFTVYALSLAVFRPLSGRLADKYGFDLVVIPGILLIMGGMLLLHRAGTLEMFILTAIFYGAGFGAAQPSLQALAVVAAPPQRRGSANATFFTGFDLGIGLSSIMWGAVAQVIGYSLMYLWAVIPAGIALVVYVLLGRGTKDR